VCKPSRIETDRRPPNPPPKVFARSAKYSLFDPAKEMVYIEMEKDEKRRGKAAVDLVGSQIGKSGASWITQVGDEALKILFC
jgi:ATP/ADP translocase